MKNLREKLRGNLIIPPNSNGLILGENLIDDSALVETWMTDLQGKDLLEKEGPQSSLPEPPSVASESEE